MRNLLLLSLVIIGLTSISLAVRSNLSHGLQARSSSVNSICSEIN